MSHHGSGDGHLGSFPDSPTWPSLVQSRSVWLHRFWPQPACIVRVRTGQWQTQRQTLSSTFPSRCLKSFFLSRSEVQPQITTEVGALGWGGVDG